MPVRKFAPRSIRLGDPENPTAAIGQFVCSGHAFVPGLVGGSAAQCHLLERFETMDVWTVASLQLWLSTGTRMPPGALN